ncbi:MAG: hypothetical protein H0X46_08075 [Bacteroidetes bacterium]|nr:hypothetical protein [Bacteroidota bacterium]
MKKIILLFLLCIGLSLAGFSQAAGKGSGEKSGGSKVKPRGQMRHFERRKKDPKMKHNGTSYKRKGRNDKKVDGDGFSNTPGKGKRRRRK